MDTRHSFLGSMIPNFLKIRAILFMKFGKVKQKVRTRERMNNDVEELSYVDAIQSQEAKENNLYSSFVRYL